MRSYFNALALLLVGWGLTSGTGWAGEPDYDAIADTLVNQSLEVRPGEAIQISGNPSQIDLMAALQVAVSKAGGQPVIILNLPEANKRAVMETSIEHLERLPTSQISLIRMFDGVINVASVQDPDLFADVPEERLAATRRAGAPLNDVFRNADFRSVSLGQTGGIPTEAYAKSVGADHKKMTAAFWKALEVSPDQIEKAASLVTGMLQPGTDVHVESKAGTDLRFRLSAQPARINAGRTAAVDADTGPAQVWLPAGEAYACVEPGSANGTVVVERTMFRGVPVENLRMTFENGRMSKMSADKNGDQLKEYFASTTDNTAELSIVDIGVNPQSQPLGRDYRSWEMGGMTSIALGNNAWAGGDNDADGTFNVHLAGTTVDVGGTRVTSAGELSGAIMAAYRR
ncbi:MAG: aminopeptidase [Gammaproteobacteria bacterium]|nr:aminopeptidase [Gammaproteobacteria bacterium]MDH3767761.1 aminopeptidase [Gammaproteobacteria bacterium]